MKSAHLVRSLVLNTCLTFGLRFFTRGELNQSRPPPSMVKLYHYYCWPTGVSYRGLLLRGGDFSLSLVALPRYDVMLRSGQSRVNVEPDSMRWELDPGEDTPLNKLFQFQKRTNLFQKRSSDSKTNKVALLSLRAPLETISLSLYIYIYIYIVFSLSLSIYIYIYIYTHLSLYM